MISIWDIETGNIVQKFGPAHGEGNKITAGCFDSTQRRLITAGSDGSVKIWNFSNGQCLKDLLSINGTTKVDKEITKLVCIHEPKEDQNEPDKKQPHFLGVGWDKILHIWPDIRNEEETIPLGRDLPKAPSSGHQRDIMSCVYDFKTNLIFTGGHDGTLMAWHFETGFKKYDLHEKDPTCTSLNFVKDAKSIDCLVIMQKERLLLSGTCDGLIRIWNLDDLSNEPLIYNFQVFNFPYEME